MELGLNLYQIKELFDNQKLLLNSNESYALSELISMIIEKDIQITSKDNNNNEKYYGLYNNALFSVELKPLPYRDIKYFLKKYQLFKCIHHKYITTNELFFNYIENS